MARKDKSSLSLPGPLTGPVISATPRLRTARKPTLPADTILDTYWFNAKTMS